MILDFNDPAVIWRLAGSGLIGIVALALIFWVGRLRVRLHKQTQKTAPAPTKKTPPGRIAHLLLALAVFAGAAWLILQLWGIELSSLLAPQSSFSARGLVRILVIIAIAAAALELTTFATRRMIERIGQRKGDRRRMAKLRTITPLISGLANAIILIAAVAMVLSEAGVEVAPLLAGAGVAGIAIGFGAQSLVKDLFTGAFLIIEDIVNHGDVVEVGGVSGVVEAMTLRTIRVRSFDGTLHIFPYGEALVIHNKTSSFSCFAFELQISYLSDIDVAMQTLHAVDEDLRKDKALADCMIGSLDLAGVDKLHDNGVILKGRIRTVAGENGKIGSAFLKLAKERLDESGVLIAHRHLPVPPWDTIKDRVPPEAQGLPAAAAQPTTRQ